MRSTCFVMAVAIATAGCGGVDYPETYPVTGVVTYQGKPLEGADVVLVPSDPKLRSAGGMTDAQGNFSVKTYFDSEHQLEGAMPGSYAVTVSKLEVREAPPGLKPEEEMAHFMRLGPPKALLPAKYAAPKTSGFQVTVGESPPEPLTLELQ